MGGREKGRARLNGALGIARAWLGRAIAYARRKPARATGAVVGVFVALALGSCVAQTPRAQRDWYPYLARTSHVELNTEGFAVSPVSDWRYAPAGPLARSYASAADDFTALRDVWLLVEPQPGMDFAAHTLLLFEFAGDRVLGVTIEARRERHEEYSAFRGLWNTYELAYVWASARDLLTRRAVMLDHAIYVYPLTISAAQQRALLQNILRRTQALETKPRFYNTLYSNCTNELAKATKLKWHYSFVATGYADEHLHALGLIPGATYADARARADVTAFAKAHAGLRDGRAFDRALLEELRGRTR